MNDFIKLIDRFINPLIWVSIILLFVEFSTGTNNSLDGIRWFLWVERATAAIFCLEYFVRWTVNGRKYPTNVMGIVDLVSWLPFAVGFFVPVSWLGWIRALRILRVFKLFRYHRTLQLFALAIYKSFWFLRAVMFTTFCFILLGTALMYEAEKSAQPESFGSIGNVLWFCVVSATTVGYGDMSPATPTGKILCSTLLFIPVIAVFGSILGIIGSSLGEVMDMEKDPNVDPIEEFKKEYELRSKIRRINGC